MRAGRLRHRLNLQQQVETIDAYGGAIITWATTKVVWGGVEALSGWENFTADQVNSALMVRIIIRYGSAISAIEQPADRSGNIATCSGEVRISATSAMKCTPQKTM